MEKPKKKWERPVLTVLVRGGTEAEDILSYCKTGNVAGGSVHNTPGKSYSYQCVTLGTMGCEHCWYYGHS